MDENLINVDQLRPFPRFLRTVGMLPTSFKMSLTYEEQMIEIIRYIRDEIIPNINQNALATKELQEKFVELVNYINTYFDNLDIQTEVNNKLDAMVESGELQEIIEAYLSIKSLLVFDNIADMKASTNLIDGSFVKTLGYYSKGDGGASYYKVREVLNTDTVDEKQIIALTNSETLIAEFINTNKRINPFQFGAKGDGTTDDTAALQYTLNYAATNHLELFLPTPSSYYLISEGLNVPTGIAGIISEKYDYTGIIRPATGSSNYTMLTIQPNLGFYCKNLTLGSGDVTAPSVNGILFIGHVGINIFEHIRVWNLDGFGFKINAIYDSVLTDISIEKCGNADEFAFSMNNDGDTCNMTTINRLQTEQCKTKIIQIADNTLNCIFNNLHCERAKVNSGTQAFHFGGYGCDYNNIRLQADGLESLATNIVAFSGTDNTYKSVRIESAVECITEGINGSSITFINLRSANSSRFIEKTNQVGKIEFYESVIGTITAKLGTRVYNSVITNLNLDYMIAGSYSEFFNCKITNMTETSQQTKFYATDCKIANLLSVTVSLIHLKNCVVTALTNSDNKIAYSSIEAYNTIFNTNVTIDSTKVTMKGCTINGNLGFITGSQLFEFLDTYVSGTVASRYTSIPTTTSTVGKKTENLKPSTGGYIGWVYTDAGWKGYGAIA